MVCLEQEQGAMFCLGKGPLGTGDTEEGSGEVTVSFSSASTGVTASSELLPGSCEAACRPERDPFSQPDNFGMFHDAGREGFDFPDGARGAGIAGGVGKGRGRIELDVRRNWEQQIELGCSQFAHRRSLDASFHKRKPQTPPHRSNARH